MKICHLITRMILGGAQENTLATVCGLAARGHDVTLISGPSRGAEGTLFEQFPDLAARPPFRFIETPHLVRNVSVWHDALAYRTLARHFTDARYDVIHTHSSKAGVVGRVAARRARAQGTTVVHTIHGLAFDQYQPWLLNRVYGSLERWCARHCDKLISVCDAMTAEALAAGVGTPAQYCTIYSGIDLDAFRAAHAAGVSLRARLKIADDMLVLLCISRLFPMKGIEDFIETVRAAQQVRPGRVIGVLVGDGPLRTAVEQQAQAAGVQSQIVFAGRVAPTDIPVWVGAADALVHASLREGLARAVVQGLAGGKPVFTYDVGVAHEIVHHDVNGSLVPAGARAQLVREVRRFVSDAAYRARVTEGAQRTDVTRFDTARMVAALAALYQGLRAA